MTKTEQEIEDMACEYADQSRENRPKIAWVLFVVKEAFKKGYTQAQKDLLASVSESFEAWWESDKDIPEILGRASERVAGITNMAQRCSILSEFWAKEAWQASRLSMAKEIELIKKDHKNEEDCWLITVESRDEKIYELQRENEDLKFFIKVIHKRLRGNESELRLLADIEKLLEAKEGVK